MPKAFLIRKKLAAKEFQAYWQDSAYQPDTPPPSPEDELNQGVNQGRRAPAQSQLAQLSNGIEPMAGPSGLSSHSGKRSAFKAVSLLICKLTCNCNPLSYS